ncbi:phosphoribosylamine--glycine ligase [Micropruina sonneratiae]|uniref:phosphoribosylamine--glycine ligase n=1 Tax=Micropruina sonneratiae TaxID=2986940 RepID=UPI0022262795|nr:phosphoribosylamine--glycine ligase [Micropruina sp. KQZ13P-5]MCW3158663.1 phosphoribosylamine--glycine ligase [Micropruina sp. KQZ13P-5]
MHTQQLSVLVVGNGGREHALALALADDPSVTRLFCAPGNPGTATVATNHPLAIDDPKAVVTLARRLRVDLVVIGPEAPLVAGVADAVRGAGIACFGPSKAAARLEGSKAFAKEVMTAAGVPTARSRFCETLAEVEQALDHFGAPHVVKDDGLAAGKGVIVTDDRGAALEHAAGCLPVVVEEFLDGPEVSLFAITDGLTALPLQPAQDFKRVGDGDSGPNTGGMGAYTPLPWAPPGLVDEIMESVVEPTIAELGRQGTPFVGLLYAGLALTSNGLRVVEFNVRFGDPETQAVLAALDSPLGQVLFAAATSNLDEIGELAWKPGSAVVVVLAADGYPGTPAKGGVLAGARLEGSDDNVHIVHAGTARNDAGELVAAGGRVLGVVAQASSLRQARADAYAAVDDLDVPSLFCRRDIAERAERGEIAVSDAYRVNSTLAQYVADVEEGDAGEW